MTPGRELNIPIIKGWINRHGTGVITVEWRTYRCPIHRKANDTVVRCFSHRSAQIVETRNRHVDRKRDGIADFRRLEKELLRTGPGQTAAVTLCAVLRRGAHRGKQTLSFNLKRIPAL